MGPSHVEDPEQLKYLTILFNFSYLKNPEDFENMVNSNTVGGWVQPPNGFYVSFSTYESDSG